MQARHADRLGGIVLAGPHREQAGPHHFGGVGTLVDAQAEQGGDEWRHQYHGIDVHQPGNTDAREDQCEVEPQQQLQDQGRAAKQPYVENRAVTQERVARQAHEGGRHADGDAQQHGQCRQDDGIQGAEHDRPGRQVLLDVRPFDLAIGKGMDHPRHGAGDHGSQGHPAVMTAGHELVMGELKRVFVSVAARGNGAIAVVLAQGKGSRFA
ncbi:hypothetical protein D3C80_920440 [compost metagenome]